MFSSSLLSRFSPRPPVPLPCFPPLSRNLAPAAAGPSPPPRPLAPGHRPGGPAPPHTSPQTRSRSSPGNKWRSPGAGQSGRPLAVPGQPAAGATLRQSEPGSAPAPRSLRAAGGWGGRRGSAWPPAASPGSSPAARPADNPQVSRAPTLQGGKEGGRAAGRGEDAARVRGGAGGAESPFLPRRAPEGGRRRGDGPSAPTLPGASGRCAGWQSPTAWK